MAGDAAAALWPRSDDASGSSDAEMVDEEGIDVTAVMGDKKVKKRKADGQAAAAAGGGEAAPAKPKVRSWFIGIFLLLVIISLGVSRDESSD